MDSGRWSWWALTFPLLFSIIGVIGVRIPLAYVCGVVMQGNLVGVWIGMCGDLLLRAVMAGARFAYGSWTERAI